MARSADTFRRMGCESSPPRRGARAALAVRAVCCACLASCASPGASNAQSGRPGPAPETKPERAPAPAQTLVAIVDGEALEFDALRPALVELAGATALRDAILDRRLARRLATAGRTISDADIAREESILLEALATDRARAIELLGEIRARQGLGPERYAALLRRNAGLRALVSPAVAIDEAGVRAVFDMRHGPKREVRIAVVESLADAEALRAERAAGAAFAELAVRRSRHESAPRGGLLAPFARLDPSYPESLRAAAFAAAPGAVTEPILDGGRFIVVEVIGETPADGTQPERVREACEEVLRLNRERLLMEELARELASTDGATIFDRGFDRAASR